MANNHGHDASLPRPHRARAPIMTVPPPITAHLAPLWPSTPVSLIQPRPECDRVTNEYVEAPFRSGPLLHALHQLQPPQYDNTDSNVQTSATPSLSLSRRARSPQPRLQHLPPSIVVTKQPPSSGTRNKEDPQHHHSHLLLHHHLQHDTIATSNSSTNTLPGSIVCSQCGRCRCHSCQQPRRLPHRWVCNNFCLCSADAIIDYTTCLCCVKAFMYHCCYEADNEEESCPDDPCSCAPDDMRIGRWTCLATMAFCLPCLWLYWPLQCGKRAVEACYARHSRQGCRCRSAIQQTGAFTGGGYIINATTNPSLGTINTVTTTPEKRLLDSSPEF